MAQHVNLADFASIATILAELEAQGHIVPADTATVRHWVRFGKVRALKTGSGHLLVSREDMLRMVTPVPVNF